MSFLTVEIVVVVDTIFPDQWDILCLNRRGQPNSHRWIEAKGRAGISFLDSSESASLQQVFTIVYILLARRSLGMITTPFYLFARFIRFKIKRIRINLLVRPGPLGHPAKKSLEHTIIRHKLNDETQ